MLFENCRIPANNLIGEEGKGFTIALDTLDGGRIGISAQAVGIARACVEESVAYAKQREQFGKKLADFQAVQWMICEMGTRLDAARLLMYRAASLRDNGRPCAKEAAMAKLFASETANKAAKDAVQIFGGNGYSKEYNVERFFRDAKITEIYEGTSQVQNYHESRPAELILPVLTIRENLSTGCGMPLCSGGELSHNQGLSGRWQ